MSENATLNHCKTKPSEKLSPAWWQNGIVWVLMISGLLHLVKLVITHAAWEGPLSPRKPALFGISSSMTLASLLWLRTKLPPMSRDRWMLPALGASLLVEVGLITLQHWRAVPSHFNHATVLDATVEVIMLICIALVMVGVFDMTIRTWSAVGLSPPMLLAIQAGMVLLSLSCLMGVLITIAGELQMRFGNDVQSWGASGVLKFPHGIALHAIQSLPLVAWMAAHFSQRNASRAVQSAIGSQCLLLIYAIWQTASGRSRWEFNPIGFCLLSIGLLMAAYTVAVILHGAASSRSTGTAREA